MSKQEILDEFSDIDFVHNNSSKYETLSSMLDELLKEQEGTINELQNAYIYLQKQFFKVQDELLEEQEEVPVVQREIAHLLFWCCGSCGVAITDGDKFCRNCGRRMKWK